MTPALRKTHRGQVVGTITRPSGVRDTGISLRFAAARGRPMIVTASAIAVTTCAMASHKPATMIQITLPISDGAPASLRRTIVRPKGHSAKFAIRNEAKPNGIVMISRQHTIPASRYPSAIQKPHSSSQMMLSSVRTPSILPASALLRGQRADDLDGRVCGNAQLGSVAPGAFGVLPRNQPHTVVQPHFFFLLRRPGPWFRYPPIGRSGRLAARR